MLITLIVAIAGVLLGGASLVWQISVWRNSGPVIKVKVHSAPYFEKSKEGDMRPRTDGSGTVSLNVVNTGRMAAKVVAWGFHLENDDGSINGDLIFSDVPGLPVEVPANDAITFGADRNTLRADLERRKMSRAMPFIRLATGEMIDATDWIVPAHPI